MNMIKISGKFNSIKRFNIKKKDLKKFRKIKEFREKITLISCRIIVNQSLK